MRASRASHKLEPAVLRGVARRLADAAGMEPSSLEASRLEWVVERRCRRLHLADGAAYLQLLSGSNDEVGELVDALVIHETRFFRDHTAFEQIGAYARRMAQKAGGSLRILSAPCSTGQEAYSLAATLAHAGLETDLFTIDAFDLSSTALTVAREGIYAATALGNVSAELSAACGRLQEGHWHMHEALRSRIRFERRNLAEPGALGCVPSYHLILCRNLFIYLHAQAREVLANSLAGALLPEGRLIIGAADRVAELDALFAPVKPASSFAFVHKGSIAVRAPEVCGSTVVNKARPGTRPRMPVRRLENTHASLTAEELYRRALEHHKRGNLRQAERRCRQALYLLPNYVPALELLEALWRLHPNLRLQRALRDRICRACEESGIALAPPLASQGETA